MNRKKALVVLKKLFAQRRKGAKIFRWFSFAPLRLCVGIVFVVFFAQTLIAQTPSPSPTPTDKRGLGIQSTGQTATTTADQQAREAKPELVLQTGYNNIWGATRLLFSPDGRLLATGTFRSNTIKLWETATNRKLRDVSSTGQTALGVSPTFVFSRDSRLIAASGADNSVKVWDVMNGRELHSLSPSQSTGFQGSVMASLGVSFIGFASDNRLVTVSDAIRVWDLSTGRELRRLEQDLSSVASSYGTDGGMSLSADGTQLLLLTDSSSPEVRFVDLSSGREVRRVKVSGDPVESLQLSFNAEGHLLAAGIQNKRLRLWNLTTKKDHEAWTSSERVQPDKVQPRWPAARAF